MPNIIHIDRSFDYIAVFLTLRCNYRCGYCLNKQNGLRLRRPELPAKTWVDMLNALDIPRGVALTFEGGEPSLHPGLFDILAGLRHKVALLTNLSFDVERLIANVPPERFAVPSGDYEPIQVTFHPGFSKPEEITAKVLRLIDTGYGVKVYGVDYPEHLGAVADMARRCKDLGIPFRRKPFFGSYRGRRYGRLGYADSVGNYEQKSVRCRVSSLLIGPDAAVHRCHKFLFEGTERRANLLLSDLFQTTIKNEASPCSSYGTCSSCDTRVTFYSSGKFGKVPAEIYFNSKEA